MKIKSLISILLISLIVFGMFNAVGAETSETLPPPVDDMKFVRSLGIDIVVTDINKTVTRAEFVYTLMSAVKCPSSTGAVLPFEDVDSEAYYAPHVAYALDMGVVSEGKNFNPDANVTISEISKMVVCALGRNIEAELNGGWPFGYIAIANNSDIFDDVWYQNSDESIQGFELYAVIRAFLESPMYEIDGFNDDMISYRGERNALEIYYGITTVEGIITANEYTSLYNPDAACAKGQIEIDDNAYKFSGDSTVGDFVTAYVKEGNMNSYDVVYLDSSESNKLEIRCNDIESFDSNKLEYYEHGSSLRSVRLTQYPAVIYNGKALPGYKLSKLSEIDGKVVVTDNNDNGVFDVINIFEAKNMYVDSVSVTEEIIIDKNEGVLNLGEKSDICYRVIKNGIEAEIADIAPDSVITYYESADSLLFTIIADSITLKGTLNEVNCAENTVCIDSVPFKYTEYFKKYFYDKTPVGTDAVFILSDTGKIAAVSKVDVSAMEYGYFIAIAKGKGLDNNLKIKLLTSDGKTGEYIVDEKTRINGDRVSDVSQIYNHLAPDGKSKEQLVRYSINDKGFVTGIDTAIDDNQNVITGYLKGDEDNYNNLTRFDFPDDVYRTIHYATTSGIVHPYFRITESTKVFLVSLNDSLSDAKRYSVKTKSYFNSNSSIKLKDVASNLDDETYMTKVYNVTAYGDAGAVLLLTGGSGGASVNESSPCGLVASVSKALSPEGMDGIKVTILKSNKYTSYYITDEYVLQEMDTEAQNFIKSKLGEEKTDLSTAGLSNPKIVPGDYVRVEADSDGIVSAILKDYDYKNKLVMKNFGNHSYECEYYYGKIYAKSGSVLTMIPENISSLKPGNIDEDPTRYTFTITGVVTTFDRETGKAEVSTSDEIIPYLINQENCHEILARTDERKIVDVVIFK